MELDFRSVIHLLPIYQHGIFYRNLAIPVFDPILFVNSCNISFVGGVITSGLAIYDTMQYIQPPISTWCVGQACSMASLLLTAGTEGMRHALPNSRIMIHQPRGQAAVRPISFF